MTTQPTISTTDAEPISRPPVASGTVTISYGTEDKRARRTPVALARAIGATVHEAVWAHRALVGNFARRELKAKYKGSVLGSLWSMVNPLATLGVYWLIFGLFLKFPPETAGNGHLRNFAIYLFTALVAWNMFFGLVTGTMGSLISAGGLLRKVYFPPSAPVFGSALATLNQTAIEFGLLTVAFILLRNISWTILFVPVLLLFLFCFSLGVGLALSVVNARYRDVAYLVGITLQLMFYMEPIVYPRSYIDAHIHGYQTGNPNVPAPAHPWMHIYYWNPLTKFVDAFRDCFYLLKVPPAMDILALAIWSFGLLALGWWIFERGAREVAEEL
jgi:ABC-type polysaccharide/polyol phosphate export permease